MNKSVKSSKRCNWEGFGENLTIHSQLSFDCCFVFINAIAIIFSSEYFEVSVKVSLYRKGSKWCEILWMKWNGKLYYNKTKKKIE